MKNSRRNFLRKTTILAASPLLLNHLIACKSEGKKAVTDVNDFKIKEFGIQLWTVKEDMAKDPKATLKAVADAGYKYVESFGGEQGIFWGMKPEEFKGYLESLGLSARSSHCDPSFTLDPKTEDDFKKLAADAASVGMKYLINPFPGEMKTADEWKKVAEGLNRQGEITKAAGLKMAYHNHHFEFLATEGSDLLPETILLEGTNAELVDYELDLYWIVKAGQNPEEWLSKYKNRFKLCHVKDLFSKERIAEIEKNETKQGDFWPLGASTFLGNGTIDFAALLPVAQANGVENFIVEQERFDNSTPLQDIVKDAEYMKKFVG